MPSAALRYKGFSTLEDERLARICPSSETWKASCHGRYAIAFTIGVLCSFVFVDDDNHTLRRGLLYRYVTTAIPGPQTDSQTYYPTK